MKAFLLAAGHGTRLRPLTDTLPKCLLKIQGVPILEIWISLCRKHGIDDLLINTHAHARMVTEYLRSRRNGVHVHVVEEPSLLGSAGTLLANREWVSGEECFWVFYADVLTCTDLNAMLLLHRSRKPVATIAVYEVPDPSRCGIVNLGENGTVQEFVEKPSKPRGNLAFAGLMLATPQLLEAIPTKENPDIGFDVLPNLAGRMLAYQVSDYLIDIGTGQNYQTAQTTWPGV